MADSDKEERKQAVAIKYEQKHSQAPVVVAKGQGLVAEQIMAAAKQHAVPVYQNKTLAGMLMAVELDSQIPPELYKAVAEVLAYVYRLDQNRQRR
ncbi:MAG: EscU/YscU/HrcU family type III secretion system export apparatus switch protein [Negativicutes bacterium]|nr:EscU/YscU/HrcU family type III secretion system export apparatus switch protein [Negativicutes bacterium]